uniref:Deoxynucleoside triphosphate triphosphohydrolase SAMHD1-like isoform X5 n=1 Tax=Crassostrea virginica TaxID=6565 RepID=A0A8B8EVC2_CRAVI|nr:deoxynucleoside triphosphate triphosphohydrolase SAMHD1-like isoform X5 [Crassostrea virginica]
MSKTIKRRKQMAHDSTRRHTWPSRDRTVGTQTQWEQKENSLVIINDPIWGPIERHPLCVRVIDTPEFQGLRSIKQLGGCSYVYPGACHNRFEHSIGTSYLAGCLGRALQKKINEQGLRKLEISEKEILCLELGGLCHDLGHGPFSHLFDLMFYPRVKMKNDDLPRWTKPFDGYKTYKNQPEKQFFFEIIANDLNSIDVDKWDYFSRDCHMLGLHHNFQCERTIKLAKVVEHDGKWHVSYPKSEWFNLFDMYYTRFTLHRRAYQHQVVKAVEIMITDALLKADKWLTFPPGAKNGVCLSESVIDMNAYLFVTDEVLHQIRMLPSKSTEENKKDIEDAIEILDRINRRDLYRLVGESKITWKDQPNQEKKKDYKQSLQEWMKSEKFNEWMKQNEIEEVDLKLYHTERTGLILFPRKGQKCERKLTVERFPSVIHLHVAK